MISFSKDKIKEQLNTDKIFELVQNFGGDPEYTSFGFLSTTICHNLPGEGSKKLYFYENTGLFRCFTGCQDTFDIFELIIKVHKLQHNRDLDLNDAILYTVKFFGLTGEVYEEDDSKTLPDWKIFANYDRINKIETNEVHYMELKKYDGNVLKYLNKPPIHLWIEEGITPEVLERANIRYYPTEEQIIIPHYDANGELIGVRGRTLGQEEAKIYGKYRPLRANNQLYNHPLGLNLYNFNNAKENIKRTGIAVIFEGEKSVLKAQSYFGIDSDIYVACCGSSISNYQIQLLLKAGAREIVIAFDRQFQKIGDDEFNKLKFNLLKIRSSYKNYATISFIFDKHMLTGYKASPVDAGADIFLKLFKERIIL